VEYGGRGETDKEMGREEFRENMTEEGENERKRCMGNFCGI